MIYNYKQSKIILLYCDCVPDYIIDGTTQDVKQRLYTLRNYYRNADKKTRLFLEFAQIKILEYFPCKNRFELNQRVKYYNILFYIHSGKYNNNLELKKMSLNQLELLKKSNERKNCHPEKSFHLDFDA